MSPPNKMSHDYYAQNGFLGEVVGDFSDDEDESVELGGSSNDNEIQFLFQPTTIENVYRPYPNSVDVGDNQVPDNLAYRHFFDQQQQSDSHDGKLYVGQRFYQLENLKHEEKMWHIKNHVTFKAKRCAKDTWILCFPTEGRQWKLKSV